MLGRLNSSKTDSSADDSQEAVQPLVVIDERYAFVARCRVLLVDFDCQQQ